MARILIVEDDESVARFLQQALEESGYHVERCADGRSALQLAEAGFDLILLDVMLPALDGLEVCRRLRQTRVASPVLLITARDSLEDKIAGLDAGGDDYIVKPFQLSELLARVRALLRRGPPLHAPVLQVSDLVLDPASRRATRAGKPINLSATEYSLLEFLMRNTGRVMTRSTLIEQVWHYDFEGRDSVLDVYISYLRSKLDKGFDRKLIHTVRGVGYRLEAEA